MTLVLLYFMCLSFALAFGSNSENAGIENAGIVASIDQGGINIILDAILNNVTDSLQGSELDGEFAGALSFFRIRYQFSKIKIASFSLGPVTTELQEPSTLKTKIEGAYFNVVGHWMISYKIFSTSRDKGMFTAKIAMSNLDLTSIIDIKDGKPTIVSDTCSSSIGDLDIETNKRGFTKFIYSSVLKLANRRLRNMLEQLICPTIQELISGQADTISNLYPRSVPLIFDTSMDISLTQNVMVENKMLSVSLSGRCFPNKYPNIRFPITAPEISGYLNSSKMIEVVVSEYVVNTFLASIVHNSILDFVVTNDMLPEDSHFQLTTEFLGSILTGFQDFPNSEVQAKISPIHEISAEFSKDLITIIGDFNITLCVVGNDGVLFNALSLYVNATATGSASIKDGELDGEIASLTATTTLGESNVGVIPIVLIDFMIQGLLRDTVGPILNDVLDTRIGIPSLLGFTTKNATLSIEQDVLKIETDIAFG